MTNSGDIQIYLFVAVAIVAMLLMSGAIIVFVVFYQKRMIQEQLKRQAMEFDYQQKMMQAELESQESERRKLAGDLHDSIGGMLSTIRVGITTIARALPDPQSIDQTKQMLDDTITSVRRISRDLLPSTLEKFGFVHAIKELCERFQSTSKIQIQFFENGETAPLDKQRELMVFRIVQELLNNAIKHADASLIKVTINTLDDEVYVAVEDDGKGFDAEVQMSDKISGKGLGLFNIQNRARLLAGKLDYVKGLTKGSKIVLTLPLQHEKESQSLHR